ncbi:HAUS augmin-like complex subunit 3 [Phyllobates terribilis]|uniref:HAUS augmin-like complex subunit 3 n=1 Tax=Phyllobates terribilis TaxID=111132 RepID=UPI003CCA7B6C
MANHLVPPPTLSRQHSASFLFEPQRIQGSDFVEMLRLIDFPGVQNLKGADFDWLCESSEEVERFLAWLCEVVDERNVLSREQLEEYNSLLDSGQPILEANELQNLCKNGDKGDVRREKEDMRSLKELEAELQSLRTVKAHFIQSRNKIESLGLTLSQNRISLQKMEKELETSLNKTKKELWTLNQNCNAGLVKLGHGVSELGQCHSIQFPGNIFLSSADIEGYISFEGTYMEKVEDAVKGMLPVKEDELEKQHKSLEKESDRLRTSWASQRIELSIALGNLHGNMESMAWLEAHSGEQVWDPLHLPLLEREVQSLEVAVEILQTQRLPLLVCEVSLGLYLTAHNGWIDAEKQRLLKVGRSQAPVAEALLTHLSRLQLLELSLKREMHIHENTERNLRDLKSGLGYKASLIGKRTQRDPRLSFSWLKPLRMDSKDHTALRLSQMLLNPSRQKELFPKYEALQRQAESDLQDLMSLSVIFQEPLPQTIVLEHDCELLHKSLCRGTRNLQLRDPNLMSAFENLTSSVSRFNQWFLDFFRELEHKKQGIQTSYLEQGRQLYVLFYRDPDLLARIVQDLEQRVADLH